MLLEAVALATVGVGVGAASAWRLRRRSRRLSGDTNDLRVTRARGANARRAYFVPQQIELREAIRTLQTRVVIAGQERPWRVLGVAGHDFADVELVACNLALALGQFEACVCVLLKSSANAMDLKAIESDGVMELYGRPPQIAEWLNSSAKDESSPLWVARRVVVAAKAGQAELMYWSAAAAIDAWVMVGAREASASGFNADEHRLLAVVRVVD